MAMLSLQQAAKLSLLNPSQREFLEDSVSVNRRALRHQTQVVGVDEDNEPVWGREESDDGMDLNPNMDYTAESLKRDEAMLKKYSPHNYPLKPYEVKKTWDEVDYLTKLIQEGMPSDKQMDEATAQNIDLHLRWTERCVNGKHPKHPGVNLVQARATRIRMLAPDSDDPNLTSIERVRPHQDTQINWKAYYAGYDEIQFGLEEKVAAAMEELDEDRFNRFCQLKAAGWTTPGIRRELGFSQEMYEAGMARLKDLRAGVVSDDQDETPDPAEANGHAIDLLDRKTVKKTIKAKGWTQDGVGKALGLSHGAINNWLGGYKTLPKKYHAPLAELLEMNVLPGTQALTTVEG